MIQFSDFSLRAVQASLFTGGESQFSQTRFLGTVLSKFAERYNGQVQAAPAGKEIPIELPSVVLQSGNGSFRVQAGPTRIDSFWDTLLSENDAPPITCIEVLEHYMSAAQPKPRVVRLALIVSRILITPKPAEMLIDRFCNDQSKAGPFNRSESFEIHNHKKYELPGMGCLINSWVRCKSPIVINPPLGKIMFIEQDLNTLPEEFQSREFNVEQVNLFFNLALKESEDILRLYFPEVG